MNNFTQRVSRRELYNVTSHDWLRLFSIPSVHCRRTR